MKKLICFLVIFKITFCPVDERLVQAVESLERAKLQELLLEDANVGDIDKTELGPSISTVQEADSILQVAKNKKKFLLLWKRDEEMYSVFPAPEIDGLVKEIQAIIEDLEIHFKNLRNRRANEVSENLKNIFPQPLIEITKNYLSHKNPVE